MIVCYRCGNAGEVMVERLWKTVGKIVSIK